ncbi:60Kd inner membrane protein-domain-containing protein [Mycena polygramma]|nr:60Kd inner membrane protein-domain-containing protein [Mycena polygramma]
MASLFGALRVSSMRVASRSPLPIPRHRLLSTLTIHRNQRPQPDTRWRNTRWNSSTAASVPVPPATMPVTADDLLSNSDSLLSDPDTLLNTIATIPPLQSGDLQALGFCNWTPVGLVQYSFEAMHLLTGLPWFYTFIATTVFWRLVIFPFAVVGMRNSARMRPITKELNATTEGIKQARLAGDTMAAQRLALEGSRIRNSAGVSMLGLVAPMVQIPISIGMFFGVKKMCELPVMQFTQSGFAWLPDLTVSGPYYILPLMVALSGNLMISMGARDMDPSRPSMGHVMNVIRIVTFLAIYWMDRFPAGLLLCLLVTSATAVLQSAIFRVPAFRAALGIPQWTPPPPGSEPLPTMRDTIRHFINQSKEGRAQAVPATSSARVQHYIPPTSGSFATMKPPTPPVPQARPRTLELLAEQQQAQARASKSSASASSLFEEPEPAPKPKAKRTKAAAATTAKPAAKKPRAKSA